MNSLEFLRADTPGTRNVIHFNNAGAGLMPNPVYNTQIEYLTSERDVGGYETKEKNQVSFDAVYESIATLINAHADEIALMENATMAWIAAFMAIKFEKGDRILTAEHSYDSNYLNFIRAKEQFGVKIDVIPSDETGQVDVSALANMMDDKVKLVAITHVPTNGGLVNPAEAVGDVVRDHPCYYLLDACQSVGQMPIDVEKIGCDFLSTTGRKWLRGPRGTGFLYVRKHRLDKLTPAFLDLHSATWQSKDSYSLTPTARRFENWEWHFAGLLGLGQAADYALAQDISTIWPRVQTLAATVRSELSQLSGVTVHDIGAIKSGIVTWSHKSIAANDIKLALRDRGINVSVLGKGSTHLDSSKRNLPAMVRTSPHYYNTEEEIDVFLEAVKGL